MALKRPLANYDGTVQELAIGDDLDASAIDFVTTPVALKGTDIEATGGLYAHTTYGGAYADGIVIDYVTGNGRISVGTADSITFYTGGPGGTPVGLLPTVGSGGVVPSQQLVVSGSAYTTPTGTANTLKQLFNATTNGALTVPANTTFFFECSFDLTAMSATSGNFQFGFGGTASISSIRYTSRANKSSLAVSTSLNTIVVKAATATSLISTSNTTTTGYADIQGTLTIGATGGTIIPSIALSIAAACSVSAGSWFRISPIGSNSTTYVGNWT